MLIPDKSSLAVLPDRSSRHPEVGTLQKKVDDSDRNGCHAETDQMVDRERDRAYEERSSGVGCGHKSGVSLAEIEQQVLHDDGNAESQNERGRGKVLCPSCCLPNHGTLHEYVPRTNNTEMTTGNETRGSSLKRVSSQYVM